MGAKKLVGFFKVPLQWGRPKVGRMTTIMGGSTPGIIVPQWSQIGRAHV